VWITRFEKAGVMKKRGVWHRILKCENPKIAANQARNINHGRVVLPPGKFTASARYDADTEEAWVWVRYDGK
jgi:hypothetical protein